MSHISGIDRSQTLLFPEAIDDYVGLDNPVRFIDAFVDGLDLAAAGFSRVAPEKTGRPGYAPGDLLKLYIYGYLNRVRSSRRLEAECHRNVEVIWLLRTLKPDFKTIADFRADNRKAFRSVFRQFVVLCRKLDLFGLELLGVDGTRIKAVNNKDRNYTKSSLEKFIKAVDERLDEYLKRLDEDDATEARTGGSRTRNLTEKIEALRTKRDRYNAMLADLERSGEEQISLTDPDSRAMAAHTKVGVGYNIQIAVDAENKMIVEQAVSNQVVDMGCRRSWTHFGRVFCWRAPQGCGRHLPTAGKKMTRPNLGSPFRVSDGRKKAPGVALELMLGWNCMRCRAASVGVKGARVDHRVVHGRKQKWRTKKRSFR